MTDSDLLRRIEELEAEVRALRDEPPAAAVSREAPAALSRRRLLRGAGMAAAGAAGALASPALTGRAAAANGDNVVLGQANSATLTTSVNRTSGTGPAVELGNAGDGAPLRLGATPFFGTTVDAGDILFSEGFFSVGWAEGQEALIYESSYAAYPYLFTPWRLLDTRYAGETSTTFGRSRVTNPVGKFDSAGRLKAGQTINVRLDDFSTFARGVIASYAVTGALNAGYLRVWDTGALMPNASILNYTTSQTIANAAMTAVGFDDVDRDSISVAAIQGTTHVIIDIGGLVIPSPMNLNALLPLSVTSAGAGQRPVPRRPKIRGT